MYGNKVKLRFFFVLLIFITVVLTIFLIVKSLEENVVYFKSPTEIKISGESKKNKFRIGGMVKTDSISIEAEKIEFIITDFKNEINVIYSGVVPNLFEEGKGVVAEGYLKDDNFFLATKILAKHDENYMPPEVKAALEEK
tara:strand:+ start:1460 stop:1879 length:420 start_codon:yes stop_codon:yes gene_type:complete